MKTLAEYEECVAIQEETWGRGFRQLVPTAILMVSQRVGGVCAAVFEPNGYMLGFVFGMTGVENGRVVHWSDLLAVRSTARGSGLGERLKRYQHDLARDAGAVTMYWTFDPLVARNAHLNLARLGATAAEYVPNMYGDNTGSPLHGPLATDRFIVAWNLAHVSGHPPRSKGDGVLVNPIASDGLPVLRDLPHVPVIRVAVPRDVDSLSHDRRVLWRTVTREAFLEYFARGYEVTAFHRGEGDELPYYEMAPVAPVHDADGDVPASAHAVGSAP